MAIDRPTVPPPVGGYGGQRMLMPVRGRELSK